MRTLRSTDVRPSFLYRPVAGQGERETMLDVTRTRTSGGGFTRGGGVGIVRPGAALVRSAVGTTCFETSFGNKCPHACPWRADRLRCFPTTAAPPSVASRVPSSSRLPRPTTSSHLRAFRRRVSIRERSGAYILTCPAVVYCLLFWTC